MKRYCKCGNVCTNIRCRSCANRERKGKYHVSDIGKRNISNSLKGLKRLIPFTEEHKRKIGLGNCKEKNGMWKGNDVRYIGVHSWIKRHKPKSELCDNCNKVKPYDLANISGKYKRDVNDFKWLCRSCHMKEDGRINNLKQFQIIKIQKEGKENYN